MRLPIFMIRIANYPLEKQSSTIIQKLNLIFILQWRRNQGTYTLQCFGKYLEGCIFVIVAEQWIEDYVLKPNDRTRSLPLNINTPLFSEGPVQIHEHW